MSKRISFSNFANTFVSFIKNQATAVREWQFPDKDGTVAMLDDITLEAVNNLGELASILEARQNLQAAHDRLTIFDKGSSFYVALTDFYSTGTRKSNPEYHVTSSVTVTLKQDSDENIPVGSVGNFRVDSGITLTFAAGSGATIGSTSGGYTLVGSSSGPKYGFAVKTAANTWLVVNGDPASGAFNQVTLVGSVLTLTNLASGFTEPSASSGRYRTKYDFTNFTQIRFVCGVSTAGTSTSGMYCQYSTDQSSWTDIGTGATTNLASFAAIGAAVSDWITLQSGNKADVWIRSLVGGGDGAADPVVGLIGFQVK